MARRGDKGAAAAVGWLLLPLTRIGRLLGFRPLFWFTMPIPYHPLIALLVPLLPLLLVGWGFIGLVDAGGSPTSWRFLLLSGLLLAIPLSLPIYNIVAFVFRVPLLQAFCFLGAMVLLAGEVVAGTEPLGYGLLPAGYALLFLVQRLGGPLRAASLARHNAAFRPVAAGSRLVRLRVPGRRDFAHQTARNLMHRKGLSQVLVEMGMWRSRGRLHLRPTAAGTDFLREVVPDRDLRRSDKDAWIEPVAARRLKPAIDLRLEERTSLLLKGHFSLLMVRAGQEHGQLASGRVAVIGNWPLMVFFYDFAVFSGGSRAASWQVGFLPGRSITLAEGGHERMLDAALIGSKPPTEADRQDLTATLAPLEGWLERRRCALAQQKGRERRRAIAEFDQLIASSKFTPSLIKADFLEEPELLRGSGRKLCQALAAAKQRRKQFAALIAANALAALPLDEFVTLEEELLPLLGSRVLLLEWRLTPDFDLGPLPRNCPRFGNMAGFGLVNKVPTLIARLGELGPRAARITAALIREVGEQPPLVQARSRLAERGISLPGL